jgi:uncharacterized membrane protein (DUF373 family)
MEAAPRETPRRNDLSDRISGMSEFSEMPGFSGNDDTEQVIGFDPPAAGVPSATIKSEKSTSLPGWAGVPGVKGSITILEHAQEIVTVVVGAILIVLAGVLLVAGIVDFITSPHPIAESAPLLLDNVLLVLILVEIVHTVVLSLRAHRLMAQPFIVVGLIAVIRRILLELTPGIQTKVSTSELALLIAMVFVFIAGLIAVSRFEQREE